jgi:hypothetical protein
MPGGVASQAPGAAHLLELREERLLPLLALRLPERLPLLALLALPRPLDERLCALGLLLLLDASARLDLPEDEDDFEEEEELRDGMACSFG